MAKKDTKELLAFLHSFPKEVQETALWLRAFVWDLYPEANELIYDNYNALAFGWSPSLTLRETFCSVAVMARYVHFGFYWGARMTDPEKKLQGKGSQYRYIIIRDKADLPQDYIKKLLKEAYAYSVSIMKDPRQKITGTTVVKSISPVKKRPSVSPETRKQPTSKSKAK